MKKLLYAVFALLSCTLLHAAPPVAEAPINGLGTPVTVAISSTTLTKVPTTQTSGRLGVFFDNPNSNTGSVVGFLGDCTSTSLAATIRPIEVSPGSNTSYFPLREDICLWLINTNTGSLSENSHYQEVKQ